MKLFCPYSNYDEVWEMKYFLDEVFKLVNRTKKPQCFRKGVRKVIFRSYKNSLKSNDYLAQLR